MKKIFFYLSILTTIFIFNACGDDSNPTPDPNATLQEKCDFEVDRIDDKLEDCNLATTENETIICTTQEEYDAIRCVANCTDDAKCEDINSTDNNIETNDYAACNFGCVAGIL